MDKLFNTKRKYIGYDGEEYLNLSIPVVDLDKISSNSLLEVNNDENGRIDTFVWKNVEEDLDLIDLTMYANHIFNPFSIKKGDLLLTPIRSDDAYFSSDEPTLPDGHTLRTTGTNKKKMTYAEKVEYFARKGLGLK